MGLASFLQKFYIFLGLTALIAPSDAAELIKTPKTEDTCELDNKSEAADTSGAYIYFKELAKPLEGDTSYTIISAPTTIEDKEWKALYNTARSSQKDTSLAKKITNFIELFRKSKGEINTTESVLLQFLIKALRIAIQPFELHTIPCKTEEGVVKSLRVTFTSPCKCCNSGRYHLVLSPKQNIIEAYIQPMNDIQAATYIETTNLQPHTETLKKALYSIAPKLAETLTTNNPKDLDILAGIFSLSHEMVHIARLDPLELLKNKESHPGVMLRKNHQKETQADLIALLMLQDEPFFLSAISLFSKFFLINFLDQIAYVLQSDSENYDLLEDIVNLHKKHEEVRSFPKDVRKRILGMKKSTYAEQIASQNHPCFFVRIQNILTAWAAYLVHAHEKLMTKAQATQHVAKTCLNLFTTFGITNKTLEQLLCRIVTDWEKMHE